jgi:hypothetical protein
MAGRGMSRRQWYSRNHYLMVSGVDTVGPVERAKDYEARDRAAKDTAARFTAITPENAREFTEYLDERIRHWHRALGCKGAV